MSLVGETVVPNHYDNHQSLGRDRRHTSPIFQLRNYNNWLKAVLISKHMNLVRKSLPDESNRIAVLDLACGKGGDLQKWAKHDVNHVVFADIAGKSVEECQSRYEEFRRKNYRKGAFKASFIVADCAKESLLEKVSSSSSSNVSLWPFEFHLVSCQFSFHYSFETAERADQMFRNAADHIKPGGYFVGTIPNASRIMKRLREADGNEFGNGAYRIKFPETFDKNCVPPLFGCTYDFFLDGAVNCPEFLVYWPLFKYLAERHGLELKSVWNFDLFLKCHHLESEGLDLLDRMRGIQSVNCPPKPENAETDDLAHVVNFLKEKPAGKSGSLFPIGTVSKSQWDIATVYLAFAFKKR